MTDFSTLNTHINLAWVLLCGMIVFFMQAGFGMLESGLVRSKNAVNVIMKNFVDMCMGSIGYWVVGFGLMFGANETGWFGASLFAPDAGTPEFFAFIFFQMAFAATAATIVSGALAERIRFWPYIFCALGICTIIYPIYGSWVWGSFSGETSGWLKSKGFIDFAGSTVVHCVGGWCALAGLICLGPRTGRFIKEGAKVTAFPIPGHNLPIASLGAFILWFGFFAFNCGSTLAVNGSIGLIALNTHLAGCAGVLGALAISVVMSRPILMGTAVNGGLAGLVAICAGADAMSPGFALLTGLVAGVIVMMATWSLDSFQIDDAVGAVPVHAFGGTWGVLAIGMFRTEHVFDVDQIMIQALGAAVAFGWVFVSSFIMFKILALASGLRVSIADERRGLDYSEHDELGYPEFQSELLHSGTADEGM